MAWLTRTTLALTLGLIAPAIAAAQAPTAQPPLKIEFRWAEEKPTRGVTDEKGLDLSCTDKKVYLHTEAVLSNADVAQAQLRKANARPEEKYFLEVTLTREAAKRMARSSAANLNKPLVVLVEGKVVAAMVVMSTLSETIPVSGYFTKAEAERILQGIK